MGIWQTKKDLINLLNKLVEHESVTGSPAEIALCEYIHLRLNELSYFQKNPHFLQLHPMTDGRTFITALVKKGTAKKTVILLSHFDVVDVHDYGEWKHLAFRPDVLTAEMYKRKREMSHDVQHDLENGEWLFGRGTMDMKAGIALHMSMIERACEGAYDGNLLLLSVPDEERHSTGMIEAVDVLSDMAQKFGLQYVAFLNSEPIFSQYPGDENYYIYTGSVGKVLPGFFCYGKETHAGEPFAGLNANFMVSQVTKTLELNTDFCEQVEGEVTPPPTNLMQKDLKEGYSVKTPNTAVTNFNILVMEQPLETINGKLIEVANQSARKIEQHHLQKAEQYARWQAFLPSDFRINVFTYEELWHMAVTRHGTEEIQRRRAYILTNFHELGDRDLSTRLVSDLAALCKEHAPMIVLFYNPPFYPAVSSRNNPFIRNVVSHVIRYSREEHQITLKRRCFFPGLSDLSFSGMKPFPNALLPLVSNMPLYGDGYDLPLQALRALQVPVMNLGPFGKDAHQWTERLNLDYSFGTLHDLLSFTIAKLLKEG